jgi:hypothetical protein
MGGNPDTRVAAATLIPDSFSIWHSEEMHMFEALFRLYHTSRRSSPQKSHATHARGAAPGT